MDTVKLSINLLVPYPDHPFYLYEGKRMEDMIESIKTHGIISPIIVRPIDDGKFEILSGHNRVEAAKAVELTEVPAIIKEGLTDDEAALIVTESNLIQRSFTDLKHSERAFVLKNHLEAIKKQGKRNDLLAFLDEEKQGGQVAHKSKSRDKIAEQYALSEKTVRRYVRLVKLPKNMLHMIDDNKLKFVPAVELSWLSENELDILCSLLENGDVKVSVKGAKRLRDASEKADEKLTAEEILGILNINSERKKSLQVSLDDEVYERFAEYGKLSEQSLVVILDIYLDLLEKGEVENVFGDER